MHSENFYKQNYVKNPSRPMRYKFQVNLLSISPVTANSKEYFSNLHSKNNYALVAKVKIHLCDIRKKLLRFSQKRSVAEQKGRSAKLFCADRKSIYYLKCKCTSFAIIAKDFLRS